jgi:integrase/recombinase XerD
MNLLQSSVDISVIALWLGHEKHRDNTYVPPGRPCDQGAGFGKLAPVEGAISRFKPTDSFLAFLNSI